MIKVSRLADYAITILCTLAAQTGTTSATELAEISQISNATVSKLLKLLAKAGLISSSRGAQGGYALSKSPASISVGDVMAAIDGPVALTECATTDSDCSRKLCCNMQDNWQVINGLVDQVLQQFSMQDMMKPIAAKHHIRRRAVFDITVDETHGK